ncbi:MAG: hypothetical protein AVDCRST_MAG04-2040, partial [uncultured Acetobacteraceae bacterium]
DRARLADRAHQPVGRGAAADGHRDPRAPRDGGAGRGHRRRQPLLGGAGAHLRPFPRRRAPARAGPGRVAAHGRAAPRLDARDAPQRAAGALGHHGADAADLGAALARGAAAARRRPGARDRRAGGRLPAGVHVGDALLRRLHRLARLPRRDGAARAGAAGRLPRRGGERASGLGPGVRRLRGAAARRVRRRAGERLGQPAHAARPAGLDLARPPTAALPPARPAVAAGLAALPRGVPRGAAHRRADVAGDRPVRRRGAGGGPARRGAARGARGRGAGGDGHLHGALGHRAGCDGARRPRRRGRGREGRRAGRLGRGGARHGLHGGDGGGDRGGLRRPALAVPEHRGPGRARRGGHRRHPAGDRRAVPVGGRRAGGRGGRAAGPARHARADALRRRGLLGHRPADRARAGLPARLRGQRDLDRPRRRAGGGGGAPAAPVAAAGGGALAPV